MVSVPLSAGFVALARGKGRMDKPVSKPETDVMLDARIPGLAAGPVGPLPIVEFPKGNGLLSGGGKEPVGCADVMIGETPEPSEPLESEG